MVETHDSQPLNELTPGKLLLQGRLQAGLTQEQVAKELYMTVSKVEALEADDHSRLKSDTFARGYIRAYANLVKVDVVLALAAYDQLLDDVKPAQVEQTAITTTQYAPRGAWQFLAVIGAFFIALWLISVWFFDNHTEAQYILPVENISALALVPNVASAASASSANVVSTDSSSAAPSSPALGANSSAIDVDRNVRQMLNTESASSVKSANFASASSAAATSKATPVDGESSIASATHAAVSSSSKKASLDQVNFSFRAESWLEVSDSRGDVLATELQPAGSEVKLVGRAPFDVKLGNARAVDIELNGKKMDVIPPSGSNVLILKIEN